MNLEQEAKSHFRKLEQSLAYHRKKLDENIPQGAKHMHELEIAALEFVMEYAKEALSQRGVVVRN